MNERQDIRLVITPKGERYFQGMTETGFVNLKTMEQRIEWNILHDLLLQNEDAEGIKMSSFLMTGRDTILGRRFASFSEGEPGMLAMKGYGNTLRRLIKEGYIKAWVNKPQKG